MISYLLSVSMNNAQLIYRMTPKGCEEQLDIVGFIRYVVRCYLATCSTDRPSTGKPSQKAASRMALEVCCSGSHFHKSISTKLKLALWQSDTKEMPDLPSQCHILCNEGLSQASLVVNLQVSVCSHM